jgi:phytase-like protein
MKSAGRLFVLGIVGAWLVGAGPGPQIEPAKLDSSEVFGLSGLDLGADGLLLAVSEHQHVLARLRVDGPKAELAGPVIPIEGIAEDLDAESLAVLGPDTVAVGTESQVPERKEDLIFLAHLEDAKARVTETIAFPYGPYALTAGKNHGLEGLCAASGVLLAGSEAVGQAAGGRFAPIGRYDFKTKRWTPFRLTLTSEPGRLASLACRPGPGDSLEALGIERQFGVMRLLRFQVPLSGAGAEIQPEILLDLAKLVKHPPDFEGVAWLPDGRVALVADNEHQGPHAPTDILLLRFP